NESGQIIPPFGVEPVKPRHERTDPVKARAQKFSCFLCDRVKVWGRLHSSSGGSSGSARERVSILGFDECFASRGVSWAIFLPVRAACQAGCPQGRGFGYAIPFTRQPQSTILNCVSNGHAH